MVLCLADRHIFMWQSLRILNIFNALTLKQVFCKIKTFFEKLEYHFLVESNTIESNTIESAIFLYKTSLPKANVKNGKYKMDLSQITTLFFWKFDFSKKTVINNQCNNIPNSHIHTFREHLSFTWKSVFPTSILN